MRNLSSRIQGLIAINVSAVIFGSAALFGKLDVSPFWIVAMRAGFAALTLASFGIARRDLAMLPRGLWSVIAVTGIILALHWLTFFASVQFAGVAVATLSFAAFPLFTVLIEAAHQRRRPYGAEILAACAIVAAVGLLAGPQDGKGALEGITTGLISAATFAWFAHMSKQLSKALPPLQISLYQNAVVALALAPLLLLAKPMPNQPMDWFWLAMLGMVMTALMHQLYFYALRRLSASVCSGFTALEPVYAILFAAWLFGEAVTLWTLLSAALIIGASLTLLKFDKTQA